MPDKIFESFLQRQYVEGMALAAGSDLLELFPAITEGGLPPQDYLARFRCKGLVRVDGEVFDWDCFEVLIYFPTDYLRTANAFQVLSWAYPPQVFHPNISDKSPFICVGRLAPGTSLVDILFQCWEIITYNKVTMREDDALNPEACAWARRNQQRFPVDRRPFKRRTLDLQIEGKRTKKRKSARGLR
jgi:ubiquitin-protein ligase